jgi:hypothetical protein
MFYNRLPLLVALIPRVGNLLWPLSPYDATYSCPYPSYARTMGVTCNSLPLLSLRCSPSPWSWTPSLMLHRTPSLSGGCQGVTWRGRRIVAAVASRKGFFHLRLPNWLANRERSRVVGFCSVMVEVSSYPGSYGPSSGRPGRSVCYSHTISRLLHLIYYLQTLYNTELKRNSISFALMWTFNFMHLKRPEIVL